MKELNFDEIKVMRFYTTIHKGLIDWFIMYAFTRFDEGDPSCDEYCIEEMRNEIKDGDMPHAPSGTEFELNKILRRAEHHGSIWVRFEGNIRDEKQQELRTARIKQAFEL